MDANALVGGVVWYQTLLDGHGMVLGKMGMLAISTADRMKAINLFPMKILVVADSVGGVSILCVINAALS